MTETQIVYLNGDYLPIDEASISVLDRGFLFGDGVYEVIPAYNGTLFRLDQHLQRLESSLADIGIHSPHNRDQWQEIFKPLLSASQDQYIYLQITRGMAPNRDHAFPENIRPTIFAMSSPIQHPSHKDSGFKAITVEDRRWDLCHIKAITLLGNILSRQKAVEQDCTEAILIKNGTVTEGAASNLFMVIDGLLLTPPKDSRILPGITRDLILELAKQNHIPYAEREITVQELKIADEIWLTSSTREILPVVDLDANPVAGGEVGPLWHKMQRLFQAYKKSVS